MYEDHDECPFCGAEILKGAMKCVRCGKYLQRDRKVVMKEEKKKFNYMAVVQLVVVLIVAWIAYKYYSDEVMGIWQSIRDTFGF
jgi:predicted nucleic acid-binding Zn ribbon protein